MIQKPAEQSLVVFSVGVYQMLLTAYPTRFRREYGSHMAQAFRDCCLRAFNSGGASGILKLWLVTLLDFIQSVVSEHRQKETQMNKAKTLKLIGSFLIIAGLALFSATFGSHSFWKFIGSMGLTGELMHPILAWLGLGSVLVGLSVLYLQLPSNKRFESKWIFGITGCCALVLIVFIFGFINPTMMRLGNPTIVFSVYSATLLGSLFVIVISLKNSETPNQSEPKQRM